MIYKLISEKQIKRFSEWWQEDDTVYTNAEAERRALESGEWHHLVVDEQPEYNPETEYLTYEYGLEDGSIHQRWIINEIKIEPTDFDKVEAQTMYTALMTDTLLEDDE